MPLSQAAMLRRLAPAVVVLVFLQCVGCSHAKSPQPVGAQRQVLARVDDSTGVPVAGAYLAVWPLMGYRSHYSYTTDATGWAAFPTPTAVGLYAVNVQAHGRGEITDTVTLPLQARQALVVTLGKGIMRMWFDTLRSRSPQ